MEQNTEDSQVDIAKINKGPAGEIKLPSFDIKPYLGKTTKIDKITEHKGAYGYYIKVQSEVLGTMTDGQTEIRASRIFGLHQDEDGKIGWDKDTNLGVYLAKYSVKHYNDLKGKEVMTQSRTSKKDGKDYLTFN